MTESAGKFALFLDSRITAPDDLDLYQDNLSSLFNNLHDPERVGNVYFIDDSGKEFRAPLREHLAALVSQKLPKSQIVDVVDNGSIYNAVNRAWELVEEEYAIRLHSDFRLISPLPLETIHKAFARYPDVYLIYIRVRGLFGYHDDAKAGLKASYPWYADYPDNTMETWYCQDDYGRVFSIPERLYQKQKAGQLPQEYWGTELFPRPIDEKNTLWTPQLPAALLAAYPSHESFAGGGGITRVSAMKPRLPIPARYRRRPPAECFEVYFWETDLDSRFYTGYLNLQAFTVCYKDPKRPLQDYAPQYWPAFLEKNSRPVIAKTNHPWPEKKARLLQRWHALLLTGYRRRLRQKARILEEKIHALKQSFKKLLF